MADLLNLENFQMWNSNEGPLKSVVKYLALHCMCMI